MSGPFQSPNRVAYPRDLDLLKQAFERVCEEYGLQKGSPEAEDLSYAVMSLFSAGVTDEEELVASLKEYIDRKTGAGGI